MGAGASHADATGQPGPRSQQQLALNGSLSGFYIFKAEFTQHNCSGNSLAEINIYKIYVPLLDGIH